MKECIRLGYPEIIQFQGEDLPINWFMGQRGHQENLDYQCLSDETYWDLKQGTLNKLTRWYLQERGKYRDLEFKYPSEFPRHAILFDRYENFIKDSKTFIVPICITTSWPDSDLAYLDRSVFPEDLLNYIKAGKATVLFYSHSEGNINSKFFVHIDTFCKNNNLSKQEAFISISDLNLDTFPKYSDRLVGFRTFNYFGQDLWWKDSNKYQGEQENKKIIQRFLKENRTKFKEKTFLCLNRRIMPHRFFMFGFFSANPDILEKTWLSLGTSNVDGFNSNHLLTGKDAIERAQWLLNDQRQEIVQIRKYYESHRDDCILKQLDLADLQMTENPTWINEDLYRTSFVNVITETYADGRGYQFLTEKTNKSIFSMLPFILVSSPGTLGRLRNLGFQTFGNYWSEEYDLIEDDKERFLEICKVIKQISKYPTEELFKMTQDMESILYHNARLLISTEDLEETLDWLVRIQNR